MGHLSKPRELSILNPSHLKWLPFGDRQIGDLYGIAFYCRGITRSLTWPSLNETRNLSHKLNFTINSLKFSVISLSTFFFRIKLRVYKSGCINPASTSRVICQVTCLLGSDNLFSRRSKWKTNNLPRFVTFFIASEVCRTLKVTETNPRQGLRIE